MAPEKSLSLSELRPGFQGQIVAIDEDKAPLKMLELGFIPGHWVEMRGKAPFGDPLHVHVADMDLAVRRKEARLVWIDPATISMMPAE